MTGTDLSMIFLSSLVWFAAAFLAVRWCGPVWDAISQRRIQRLIPRLQALGLNEAQIAVGLRWWGITLLVTFVTLAIALRMLPVAIGATLLVFIAPRYVLDRLIERRQIKLRDQLVRAATGVANACRAGLSLPQAMEKVALETAPPLSRELRRIVRDYKAGRPLPQAIREVQYRLALEPFNIFASTIIVALEKGGNVTYALERISSGLQEMQRLERKLEADSASGRRLATLLAIFPVAFLLLFTLLDPVATGRMYTTLPGNLVLVTIGLIVYVAAKWCQSILDLDF